ncbi:MAG: hypothetical protein HZA51_05320 [Planctomycetes bacterium]|nr:hypothetical protein [Planctomycetota bacterium]
MSPRKTVLGFFIRLAVLYTVLIASWPMVRSGYCGVYRKMGSACFSRLGDGGTATFENDPTEDAVRDTVVVTVNTTFPDARIEKRMPISARYTGYFPTVVVVSLVLSTPLAWPRRLRSLAVGLLLVNVFILAWLGVSIWDDISEPLPQVPVHGFILSPWAKSAVHFLVVNVVDSLVACSYVVPVFIWILACFGAAKDRESLLRPFVEAPTTDPSSATATPPAP